MASKRERTRERILAVALALVARDGYEATTVGQIAAAAGVSEMTFFRHFASKSQLVLDDPYDPLIADAVAAQPTSLAPLTRVVRGVREAWRQVPEPATEAVRERLRIAARTPALRAVMTRNTEATERVVIEQLVRDGVDRRVARIVAAAVIAAVTAALIEWATDEGGALGDVIEGALAVLEPGHA